MSVSFTAAEAQIQEYEIEEVAWWMGLGYDGGGGWNWIMMVIVDGIGL